MFYARGSHFEISINQSARQPSSIITGADTGVHSGAHGWSAKVYRYVLLSEFEVCTLG